MNDTVISFRARAAASETMSRQDPTELRKACLSIVERNLGVLVQRMFDGADDTLFAMADKAENNRVQSSYFDAMRELRLKQKRLESDFLHNIEHAFMHFRHDASHSRQQSFGIGADGLSLLKNEVLEEDLAIANMARKAEGAFADLIQVLNIQLNAVLVRKAPNSEHNPLAPQGIAEAIRQAFQALDAEIEIKLVIYKLFDKEVMVNLGEVYRAVHEYLTDAGIVVDIKARAGFKRNLSYVNRDRKPWLRRLDTATDTHKVFDNAQVAASTFSRASLKKDLITEIRKVNVGHTPILFDQFVEEVVDTIIMLFDFVLADASDREAVKALLEKLSISL